MDSRIPRHRNVAAIDSLILPIHEKQFFYRTSLGDEWGSFWNSLWNSAAEALRASDRIVICGYSVLPIDERACALLLEDAKIEAQFDVCCGDDSIRIAERLKSFGRDARPAAHTMFADWVAGSANI